ncbi:hypothetical protein ACSF6K_00655 [Escherichia coli]|uniref:hypothetical protein n=1 Tax=Escherichia coli TaxID=562 RepID=UPI003EEF4557
MWQQKLAPRGGSHPHLVWWPIRTFSFIKKKFFPFKYSSACLPLPSQHHHVAWIVFGLPGIWWNPWDEAGEDIDVSICHQKPAWPF